VILLANNIKRWAHNGVWGLDGRLEPVYNWVISHLPKLARQTGIPPGEQNDGLIKDWDEFRPACRIDGRKARSWIHFDKVFEWNPDYGEIVPVLVGRKIELPPNRDPTVMGFHARVWKLSYRPLPVSDDIRSVIWHYLHSYRKVELKCDDPVAERLKGLFRPYEPYVEPCQKLDVQLKVRVVSNWGSYGPWTC
jgi:hypothetical protein